MKIAIVSHLHYPIKQPYAGGLEAHTDLLIRELVSKGHQVALYAKVGSKTVAKLVPIFKGDAKGGSNESLMTAYRYAYNHIELQDYDLIFNNSLHSYPFMWHTPEMPPMITIFHTPPFWELSDVIQEQIPQKNRVYVAVSEFTARQWQAYCQDKVRVVTNGIDMSRWHAYVSKPEKDLAIWTGRITKEKGPHIAIAAARIAGIPLVICGGIYDQAYFDREIKPHVKSGEVTYKGHLDQQELNALYGQASIALVTPLWDEPFGFVTVEALASGVPVAALAHGATASILKDQYGALAHSDSPQDLANAIQRALVIDRTSCARYANETYNASAMVVGYFAVLPSDQYKDTTDSSKDLAWQP